MSPSFKATFLNHFWLQAFFLSLSDYLSTAVSVSVQLYVLCFIIATRLAQSYPVAYDSFRQQIV
jgi:hypothetical protein